MSRRHQFRAHRIAVLIAVALIHVLAVRELFWQPFLARVFEPPETRGISWIALPPPVLERPPAFPDFAVPTLVVPFPNVIIEQDAPAAPVPAETLRSPQVSPVAPSTPREPADSAILGTLGRSLGCNLLNYEKLSRDEKERCIALLAKVQNEPAATYTATDEEMRLTREFARELAVKQAPPLLPCSSTVGLGVSVYPCLVKGLLNGFDFSDAPSYADAQTTDK